MGIAALSTSILMSNVLGFQPRPATGPIGVVGGRTGFFLVGFFGERHPDKNPSMHSETGDRPPPAARMYVFFKVKAERQSRISWNSLRKSVARMAQAWSRSSNRNLARRLDGINSRPIILPSLAIRRGILPIFSNLGKAKSVPARPPPGQRA